MLFVFIAILIERKVNKHIAILKNRLSLVFVFDTTCPEFIFDTL